MRNLSPLTVSLLVGLAVAVASLAPGPVGQTPAAEAQVGGGATLTVLVPPVEVQRATGFRQGGVSGMTLNVGDRVITGQGAFARLTFFEGSEMHISPRAEVMVRQLQQRADGGTFVAIGQALGSTLSRVTHLLAPRSGYAIETPSAVALVRGTELETTITEDGFQIFRCITGTCSVTAGGETTSLQEGEVTVVPPAPPDPTADDPPPFEASDNLADAMATAQARFDPLLLTPGALVVPGAELTATAVVATPTPLPTEAPLPTATPERTPTNTPEPPASPPPPLPAAPPEPMPTPTATSTPPPTLTPTAMPTPTATSTPPPTLTPGPTPAQIMEYTVTRFDDGDSTCTEEDCALREAILAANTDGLESVIFLEAGTYRLTISGSGENQGMTGDLDVTGPHRLTIVGQGSDNTLVHAGNLDRVFDVHPGADLELVGLRVTGGAANSGGGLRNRGVLSLDGVFVQGNLASGDGGGILNLNNGGVTVSSSTVSGNSSGSGGGGISNRNSGTVTLLDSTLSNNTSDGPGGGIFNLNNGAVTVSSSTVSGNSSGSGGGGISNRNSGELTIVMSTLDGNSAASRGGGIENINDAILTVHNSTLSGNTALGPSDGGGGLFVAGGSSALRSVTIAQNSASSGAGTGIFREGGTVSLVNTIVANTVGSSACEGTITSAGNNLDTDRSCSFSQTDLSGVDPLLGPLQFNPPGATATHALLAGSPAIDTGQNLSGLFATDQRGVHRPQGLAWDIGAFERD